MNDLNSNDEFFSILSTKDTDVINKYLEDNNLDLDKLDTNKKTYLMSIKHIIYRDNYDKTCFSCKFFT